LTNTYLKNYKVQCSNDDFNWINLVDIVDNKEPLVKYDINLKAFRYFRIYITKPSNTDNIARIAEFEAWGPE